jgi:hypothetical protein
MFQQIQTKMSALPHFFNKKKGSQVIFSNTNTGTVRTVNFVTLRKLNVQKINGTKPKTIDPLCLKTLSF